MKNSQPKLSAGGGPPHDHLGYLFKRLQHSMRQAFDEALRIRGVGLSFAHVVTLFCISHEPGISGAQIAKRTMVTAQTVNTILHRLEKDGSVERRPHSENRRVDCWYITDVGRTLLRQARAAGDPVWTSMLAPLSEAEVVQLRGLLKRCIEGLERTRAEGANDDFSLASSRAGPGSIQRNKKRSKEK